MKERFNFLLLGIFITSIIALFSNRRLFALLSVGLLIYFIVIVSLHYRQKRQAKRKPQSSPRKSKTENALSKLKAKRAKEQQKRHDFIHSQIDYIADIWDLTKQQERTFYRFIDKRAYTQLYSRLTAALLPQLIKMIEECLEREKRGCQKEINRRINELVAIMKQEISNKQKRSKENFETLTSVYDHLIQQTKEG